MTSNIQISGKSAGGVIFVVGGDNFDDFLANLTATVGDYNVANEIIQTAAQLITPPSVGGHSHHEQQAAQNLQQAGFQQQPQQNVVQGNFGQQQQGYQQPQQRQSAGAPPGQQAPLCPNHNAPGRWVAPGVSKSTGKPYNGFWSCAQGDRSCRFPR